MTTFKGNGVTIVTVDEAKATRHCGGCTLCCKLLPIRYDTGDHSATIDAMVKAEMAKISDFAGMTPDFDKPAGERCPHQRSGKGCSIYGRRPLGCRIWNCAWLGGHDTHDQRRPDRSHVVIDIMPDFVTITDSETGKVDKVEVVQIWVDPNFPDAHRAPEVRAFMARRAAENKLTLIRPGAREAFVVWAPSQSPDGQWHEMRSSVRPGPQHTAIEIAAAIGGKP